MIDQALDNEEQEIIEAYERGDYVPVEDFEETKREAEIAAKNTMNKTRNINIRLTERDLYRLKAKAMREGIPYQTLAASIIHKSTSEK